MRLAATALAIFAVVALAPEAAPAVETYSSSRFHQVIAKAVVPDRNDEQLYFSIVAGTFWSPQIHKFSTGDGIYYQFTGDAALDLDDRVTTLRPGDGVFIAAGAKFALKSLDAGRAPTYLQFLLSSAPGMEAAPAADGMAVELYRSPSPIPGLTHERNLLSLVRVPVPPQSTPDPLHRRTGAALHYVLSGTGAELADGRIVARGPGSVSYEPAGFSYQWSNPGLKPLIYLLFNINRKDAAPVIGLDQQPEDPFLRDRHLTVAIYCVALSMLLTVVVSSFIIADHHRQRAQRDRDKR